MGYTTEFEGRFDVSPPLSVNHLRYLTAFSETRRMERQASLTEKLEDPIRHKVNLPVGIEGGYYVGDQEDFGQTKTSDITGYNTAPEGQPGLWCGWVPAEDGESIEWNGAEKFYEYVPWLQYLITHFLSPWGYKLNGDVTWQGEESGDMGLIRVKDNVVKVLHAEVTYKES